MDSVSVSELKINPSRVIKQALDYPVAVEKRNQVKAYLLGKELYEKIVTYIEDYLDRKTTKETDFSKGKDFEKVAQELGI
ncbi:type II toxin-antitoxin system Phd/YefM family antitoxin [Candidatus Microgenomates bacterium]|nr:type II toxin-antitoxin system Phd/YefM family antitoxin [Candidatus Microgenomates bacterium]